MLELALDTDLDVQQRDFVHTAWLSAEGLLAVINEILDFSKVESAQLQVDRVPFTLRPLMSAAVAPLRVRAEEKGVELRCDVAPEVPDSLVGDGRRLRQVIVNLVGNAIKFTSHAWSGLRPGVGPAPGRRRVRPARRGGRYRCRNSAGEAVAEGSTASLSAAASGKRRRGSRRSC